MGILSFPQHTFLPSELTRDNAADFFFLDHLVHLFKGDPFGIVCFAGKQYDFRQGCVPFQAIIVIMESAIATAIQQFKLIFLRADTGFFKQFPGDRLTAMLSRMDCATGIFPRAGEGFFLSPFRQQEFSVAIIRSCTVCAGCSRRSE